jgi:hypothetical protein
MATYVNDLRLKEIATGDESGTWGTSTNTNLELIAEAMGVGAEAVANASTHTITMADGATDQFRSTFLRLTGGGQACTVTLAPNTLSHTWIMRNETAAALTLTQGSGANVAIAAGQTKIVATDGAGSGAVVYEMDDLELAGDLSVGDDLTFTSDSAVITFGADGDTTLTHTDGAGLTLNSTNKIMFNDASQFIQGSSATVLSLGATDEIDLTATAIDVNGTMDVSGKITADAGIDIDNINIDGTTIALSSGDLTLDVAGSITLDAAGSVIDFDDNGTNIGRIENSSSNFKIESRVQDKDILFVGNDGGSGITALTLDMSAAGAATFISDVSAVGIHANQDAGGTLGAIRLLSVRTDSGTRNWAMQTNFNVYGDFVVRQSNAKDGNPMTAGTDRLSINAAGVTTLSNGLTLADGNVVVAAGHGIDFSANSGATGVQAELLNDYETGTWTMGLTTTSSDSNITTVNTTGYYTKIGNLVTVNIYNAGSNVISAGTGTAKITGLPFSVLSGSGYYSATTFAHTNIFATSYSAYPGIGTTEITVTQVGSIAGASFAAGNPKYMMLSLTYMTGAA